MNGIVQGGWPFVIAAYAATVLVLGGYALHAIVLHRVGRHLGRYDHP